MISALQKCLFAERIKHAAFLLLIFFAVAASPVSVSLAQDAAPPSQKEREEAVFKDATDEQIIESQKFYKHCTSNETMNAQRDCQCAATSFLESRIRMGQEAKVQDIMDSIKNLCLTSEDVPVIENSKDMSRVTDKRLKDMQEFYESCKADLRTKRDYDCQCLAAEYFDYRDKAGPALSQEVIIRNIGNRCFNYVEKAGETYTMCMEDIRLKHAAVIPQKYCECVASKWVDELQKLKGNNVHSSTEMSIYANAGAQCRQQMGFDYY